MKILLMVTIAANYIYNVPASEWSRINTLNSNSEYSEFIDDHAFEYIGNIYSDIDFSSDFKQGDQSVYADYKEQYLKLLECEIPFKSEGKKYYIDEYIYGDYYPENYTYYFFDMDDDNSPELCIENKVGYIYIMKYLPASDEVILWHEASLSSWTELLGSRKLWYYSGTSPVYYAFHSLDENGYVEYSVWFYIVPNETETEYWLTLPEFSDKTDDEIPKDIKAQSIEKGLYYYYRVTESQWDELTKKFFNAKDTSKENIEAITFTYNELFNN